MQGRVGSDEASYWHRRGPTVMSRPDDGDGNRPNWTYWVGGLAAAMSVIRMLKPETERERAEDRANERRASKIRAERERLWAQEAARNKLGDDFWLLGAEGRKRLDAQTLTSIPIANPYSDVVAGKGTNSTQKLSSAQAGLELEVRWIVQDNNLTIWQDGLRLFDFENDLNYPNRSYFIESDELPLLRKVARLLAGHYVGTLRVRRTDWRKFQVRIWEDYLRSRPDVAAQIGWTGSPPYPELSRGLRNIEL